jgi:hypothetical protein
MRTLPEAARSVKIESNSVVNLAENDFDLVREKVGMSRTAIWFTAKFSLESPSTSGNPGFPVTPFTRLPGVGNGATFREL